MAVDIKVPSLGESVSEAIIAQWFKAPGEAVAKDEPIVELETDKINVEINAPEAGVLKEQRLEEGESVGVGDVIATIDTSASGSEASAKATEDKEPVDKDTRKDADVGKYDEAGKDVPEEAGGDERSPNADVMPPSVTRLVNEHKLDPSKIKGTGKGGRLTKGDVLEYIESGAGKDSTSSSASSSPAAPATETVQKRQERVKMTPLRRTIARRLVQAQSEAAMLTTFNEVDMTNVMAVRSKYKQAFIDRHGIKLGFMSFFVKAAVDALKAFPGVNAEVDGDHVIYKYHYDIGVAVGGGKGLVVPVIKGADRLGFADVEKTIGVLAGKAQKNKLTMDDLTGGTFTISNGGIYGSMMSTPILNPPQTGILGMHNIIQRPIAIDGQVEIRPMMYLALSYDHRVVDGREAVSFLVRLKECIENPERMLLEV